MSKVDSNWNTWLRLNTVRVFFFRRFLSSLAADDGDEEEEEEEDEDDVELMAEAEVFKAFLASAPPAAGEADPEGFVAEWVDGECGRSAASLPQSDLESSSMSSSSSSRRSGSMGDSHRLSEVSGEGDRERGLWERGLWVGERGSPCGWWGWWW